MVPKQGAHILERGLQIYHGVRGAIAAGSAVASAAAPYMTAMALYGGRVRWGGNMIAHLFKRCVWTYTLLLAQMPHIC